MLSQLKPDDATSAFFSFVWMHDAIHLDQGRCVRNCFQHLAWHGNSMRLSRVVRGRGRLHRPVSPDDAMRALLLTQEACAAIERGIASYHSRTRFTI